MDFCDELDELLSKTYATIQTVEEHKIKKNPHLNLTITELHLMEYIGKYPDEGRAISDIAAALHNTMPTITVAVNKLENKGYVHKIKHNEDKRVVLVKLSKAGEKVNSVHQYIHKRMSLEVAKEFSEEERKILLRGLEKLNEIFKRNII